MASFAAVLRQYRMEAELTQEVLAERAELSPRSIQKLERGETLPYPVTMQRLIRALGLNAEQRARFQALAARASKRPPRAQTRARPERRAAEGTEIPAPPTPASPPGFLLLELEGTDLAGTEPQSLAMFAAQQRAAATRA